MSGSLWLKHLRFRYRNYSPYTEEEMEQYRAEIMERARKYPLPPPTPEQLAELDRIIAEADEKGWIPGHPKDGMPMNGIRTFKPHMHRQDNGGIAQ